MWINMDQGRCRSPPACKDHHQVAAKWQKCRFPIANMQFRSTNCRQCPHNLLAGIIIRQRLNRQSRAGRQTWFDPNLTSLHASASYCLLLPLLPHHSLASYSSFTSPPLPVKGSSETQFWCAPYINKNDNIQQRKLIECSGRFERWDCHCRSANIPAGWSPSSGTSASYKAFNSHKSSSFNWQWRLISRWGPGPQGSLEASEPAAATLTQLTFGRQSGLLSCGGTTSA